MSGDGKCIYLDGDHIWEVIVGGAVCLECGAQLPARVTDRKCVCRYHGDEGCLGLVDEYGRCSICSSWRCTGSV